MTLPFTIVLNLLVMIAVKTKARIQSASNLALACLASTGLMVRVIVQPLYIALLVALLNDQTTAWACSIHISSRIFTNLFCFASILHLLLMSGDRYIAIKHAYTYVVTVTKTRVLVASLMAWILAVVINIILQLLIDEELFRTISSCLLVAFILAIVICNAIVYLETRRHEHQIAARQVSLEARENFLR